MPEFLASKCGTRAYQDSITPQAGCVIGNASRGIFIKTEKQRIVYVSSERYRNPLNINLDPYPEELRVVELNESTSFGKACVSFPALGLTIRIPQERVFQTPSPHPGEKTKTDQLWFLNGITRELLVRANSTEFISVIHSFLENEAEGRVDEHTLSRFLSINNAADKNNLSELIPLLIGFLGDGSGLTPSGDDLVIGFLLAMNRWNPRAWQPDLFETLNTGVSTTAKQKTTTLSANMIELAVSGDADERLIVSLDSIFTGEKTPAETAKLLRSYGSSSGIDSFCGMALLIK
jgi:hypothetical protein